MIAMSTTCQYLSPDAYFLHCFLQGVGIALGLLLQRVLQLRVYRYAGLAMLMAAVIIGLFPNVNDFMINLIEKIRPLR